MTENVLDIPCGKDDIDDVTSRTLRAWMRLLAKRRAAKMTAEERRLHAVKMNEARWGKLKGGK